MRISIERLEIELPDFMKNIGDIVLGVEHEAHAADGRYNSFLANLANTAISMLTEYMKPSYSRPEPSTVENADPDRHLDPPDGPQPM
jgi:hypothetical protein